MPRVAANGLELYFEDIGSPADPALVLIAGLGSQCTNYPDELCTMFVQGGFRVIRFDNRDCGLTVGPPSGADYSLSDMGRDVVGLLDAMDVTKVHLWGSSMGGMVAQTVAIEAPERVATLISVQSTTGEPDVGQPAEGFLDALVGSLRPPASRRDAIEAGVSLARMLTNNPEVFDEDVQRDRYSGFYDRAHRPEGSLRQAAAVMAAPDRSAGLAGLEVPALVIHGNRDPLIDISGGRRTAELVPRSRFVEVDGMGHDLSRAFWSGYVDATVGFVSDTSG